MTKSNAFVLSAANAAMTITLNKKIARPMLANLYQELKKSFPFFGKEVNEIARQLDADTWYTNEEMLEHIVVIEDKEFVTVHFSEELAQAYLDISIKTLPIMSILYTSYTNIMSVIKLSGVNEACDKFNDLLTKLRTKTQEPAVKVKRVSKRRAASV